MPPYDMLRQAQQRQQVQQNNRGLGPSMRALPQGMGMARPPIQPPPGQMQSVAQGFGGMAIPRPEMQPPMQGQMGQVAQNIGQGMGIARPPQQFNPRASQGNTGIAGGGMAPNPQMLRQMMMNRRRPVVA